MPSATREDRARALGYTGSLPLPPDLDRLMLTVAQCQECKGDGLDTTGWAASGGDPNASLVLIGESPGNEERKQHRAFVGPSGALLDTALAHAGSSRDRVWVTNAVRCWLGVAGGTPAGDKGKLTTGPAPPTRRCARYWMQELVSVCPLRTLCLGRVSWEAVTGDKHPGLLGGLRGRWQYLSLPEWPGILFPVGFTYHPAAALRDPEKYLGAIMQDVRWAWEECNQ